MVLRRIGISIGVAGTAFLAASVVGFAIFGGDFPSVFYVLPIALATAFVVAGFSFFVLGSVRDRGVVSALAGAAAFGYSFFLLWFVRYSIAATRGFLSFDLVAVLGIAVAVGVAALAWISEPDVADD